MKKIPLIKRVDLSPCGGQHRWFLRVEAGGELRMVSIQSAGMLDSRLYRMGRFKENHWIEEADQDHHCISMMDLEGNVIWQRGSPWDLNRPWRTHGGMQQAAFHDVDGDGLTEMVYVHKDRLVMLDASSGELKGETVLEADNFAVVLPVNVEGNPHRRVFLLKVQDASYEPYSYGNPVVVYDSNLDLYWQARPYIGAGHHPWAIDSDGDGKEEILVGYNLVDHDGTTLWTLDIPDPHEHCDNRDVVDRDGDGVLEIAYAGSKDAIVCDIKGNLIDRLEGNHTQDVCFAKLDRSRPGLDLICSEKWGGITAYGLNGRPIWTRKGANVTPIRWDPDDSEDLLLYREPDRPPVLVDGRLEPVMAFEAGENLLGAINPPKEDPYAVADYGNFVGFEREDVNGDGVKESIFYNRHTMWIYGGAGTENR